MTRFRDIWLWLSIAFAAPACAQQVTVIEGATVIDGVADMPIRDAVVVIEHGPPIH